MADLAKFYGWAPESVGALSGTELAWWCDRANELVARARAEGERRRGR